MKKASEYRTHAAECRALAARMESADQRDQLLRMADHWERLARDRIELLRRRPALASEDERAEVDAGDRRPGGEREPQTRGRAPSRQEDG